MKTLILVCTVLCLSVGCTNNGRHTFHSREINNVISAMTDVMVHDVTNPPLAARFFSYACLAGYEVVSQNDQRFASMHGVLKGYPDLKQPDSIKGYSYELSALLAMIETAMKMQPSGKLLANVKSRLLDSCKIAGMPANQVHMSEVYASFITSHVLRYAKADRYNRISNYARYTPEEKEGHWYPTPPAYIAAVEPYFNTVRPFTLDTSIQFKPLPPVDFSADKNSSFYKMVLSNYQLPLSAEQKDIAAFWDCNPFAVQDNGHLLVGLKKISPGAHWLGITGIACIQGKKSFAETMKITTTVSLGLMDAFICCWDEKYRSNRIRPETAIRKYIDAGWVPLLQTPPFPEYLSGHSVISASSATILSHYFGDNFPYTDTVEVRFGLPSRKFTSFRQAAKEAAISRFYGGIHFMDAIDNGFGQGEKVGRWVIETVERPRR